MQGQQPAKKKLPVFMGQNEVLGGAKGFKSNLPTKACLNCNRPFQYRKKWKLVWDEVKYCSEKCKREAKKLRI